MWESKCLNPRCCFIRTTVRTRGTESDIFVLESLKIWCSVFTPVLTLPVAALREYLGEMQENIKPHFRRCQRRKNMLVVRRKLTFDDTPTDLE